MLKKNIGFVFSLIITLFVFANKTQAYAGNGFIWNKTEVSINLNSNFDDILDTFEVKFYYKGEITDKEVKVELDSFYYGNLSITTSTVETKIVKLIATVDGYSSYDRRDITLHIVDTEPPKILKLKELEFEVGQVVNFEEYFRFTDNDEVSSIEIIDSKINFSVPGNYELEIIVCDNSYNYVKEKYNVYVCDTTAPSILLTNFITVEYGDIDFDIRNYVKVTDTYEGDLTSSVTLEGLNIFKLGDQTVTVSVVDSSGNRTTVSKVITVVDTTAPTLELTCYSDIIYLEDGIPDFASYIYKCYDNVDDLTIDDVIIDSSDFSFIYGAHTISYKLIDKTNNYSIRNLNLNVSYKTAPTITVEDLEFDQYQTFNLGNYIKVTDLYDDSISNNYLLYDSNLDSSTPGTYEIYVEATNKAGQTSIAKFYVTIKSQYTDNENIVYDVYDYIYDNKLILIGVLLISVGIIVYVIKKKKKTKIGE